MENKNLTDLEKDYISYLFGSILYNVEKIKESKIRIGLLKDLTMLKNFIGTDAGAYECVNNCDKTSIEPIIELQDFQEELEK